MSFTQLLRMVRTRWRLALLVGLAVAVAGAAYALRQPRQYAAEAQLVLDVRPDLVLGALGSASSMITQLEILKTEKVGLRAVAHMRLKDDPVHQAEWRKATKGNVPIENWLAGVLMRGLTAEAIRGSNVIGLTYASDDPAFAVRAVNAIATSAAEVAVALNTEPARESAAWFDAQAKNALRANLEAAQARLSRFQQENGILFSEDKTGLDQARVTALEAQLASALNDQADAAARERAARAGDAPEAQRSGLAISLANQISTAEGRLVELSGDLGSQHPRRRQLEAQIADLRAQLARENARVAGVVSLDARSAGQRVAELRAQIDQQKRQLLSMRTLRDQMSVLQRDVEAAQRTYDGANSRASQLALESESKQAGVRVLGLANEAPETTGRKLYMRLAASLGGALLLGAAVAIGLELLDRRVRHAEDLQQLDFGPLLGVLDGSQRARPAYSLIRLRPNTPVIDAGAGD